ncbi:BTB domain-containing protein [Madurella fahalii]|uniref:BTB domain-containing protein n=1 Tax=Madurella fahalii TaxID=1157608 RepID=A0ABQ0FZD0_9PEZI
MPIRWSTKRSVVGFQEGCDVVKVLVGDEQREFTLDRKLLCDSCAFFRTNVEAIPSPSTPGSGEEEEDSVLWLPGETPDMFELFVLWLYQRRRFHSFLDKAIQAVRPEEHRTLRTHLVHLHLFAAVIDLPSLQDMAMDALQDMYLRFDWDMSPRFLAFLYSDYCDAQHAVRLRKWAVAMLAWTLHGADKAASLAASVEKLFAAYPPLRADYLLHLDKMAESRADVRIKNPQLRLPANGLRSGERYFGFRQCTFHSHRATVGEGACPWHANTWAAMMGSSPSSPSPSPPRSPGATTRHGGSAAKSARRRRGDKDGATSAIKDGVESDESEEVYQQIISPVGDLNEISYLDLS